MPANVTLKVALNEDARDTAWFSIDGQTNKELNKNCQILITTSEFPLPSICKSDFDWFQGLAILLHWNQRHKQLPIGSCFIKKNLNQTDDSILSETFEKIE